MKLAATALLGAAFTAASCYSIGALLLRRLRLTPFVWTTERIPLCFTLGAAILHLFFFAVLAAQVGYWPVLIGPMLAALILAIRSGDWSPRGYQLTPPSQILKILTSAIGAAFLTLYFVYAWAPEHSPDGSSYHLGFIARYVRTHGMEKITTNLYAMLGQGVELIFLPAFIIGRHSAAALVHLCFAVALAFSMFAFGRRLGKPWVGAAAAVFTFVSPVFGIDASIAYIDVGTAAIVFATFYWLHIWDNERDVHPDAWRLLIPAGLLAGYAFAAKFTAFTIGIYALGFVAWKARKLKPVALVAACGLLMAGPWVARNWLLYQNPMAPLGTAIFRNPYTHVLFEQEYSKFLSTYNVADRRTLPLEVTLHGTMTQGIIGPLFLLLPLGIFALRHRVGRQLWIAAMLVSATYVANVGTRFLIPGLPFFSFLIALPLAEWPVLLGGLMIVHAGLSWPSMIPRYADEYAWRMDGFPLREALRLTDTDDFLQRAIPTYAATRLIEGFVPENEAVFAQTGMPDAYTRRTIRVSFQSASNELMADLFNLGWQVGSQPIRGHIFRFPATTGRRFRLLQTAHAPYLEQWNIHELRFFSKGVELERRPDWRLQSWPNPWDVQLAFDNSPATRWRSWETPAPGMFVEVDFGAEQSIDEIRIETSADSPSVRMQPERWTGSAWQKLSAELQSIDVQPNPNARRMATYEMHQRGLHYILLMDTDFGAEDVREDPESWSLKLIAQGGGARLYKTTW